MIFIGVVTAIIGAASAVYQEDLKKILAFSTIANCGFMLVLLSWSNVEIFVIYFILHGLFKSACFMFSGDIIIAQHHKQDNRVYTDFLNTQHVNKVGIILSLVVLSGSPITLMYLIKHSYILNEHSVFC